MRQTRQEATLRRWLEALPDDVFARPAGARPSAWSARGWPPATPTGVEPLLERVESMAGRASDRRRPIVFDDDEFARLPAQVAVYRAGLALLAGDIDGTIAHASRVLELAEPSDHFRRGAAHGAAGPRPLDDRRPRTAERRYAEAVAQLHRRRLHPRRARLLPRPRPTSSSRRAGSATRTRTFESGLEHAEQPGLRGTADMHVGLSEVLLERNDLDAAARHLAGEQRARRARRPPAERLPLARRHGSAPLSARRPRRRARAARRGGTPLQHRLLARRCDRSPRSGRGCSSHAATSTPRAAGPPTAASPPTTSSSYVREFEHITLARTLLAQHAVERRRPLEQGVTLLDRLLAAAEDGQRTGSAIEILVLLALAHHARGDVAAAARRARGGARRAPNPRATSASSSTRARRCATLLRRPRGEDAGRHTPDGCSPPSDDVADPRGADTPGSSTS